MKSLIIEHFNNHLSSWSLGALGALGEFSQAQQQALLKEPDQQLCIATARGGISINRLDQCTAIASEMLSKHRVNWGMDAQDFPIPNNKLQRLAVRIALRQAFHNHQHCARLSQWRDRFDRAEKRTSP